MKLSTIALTLLQTASAAIVIDPNELTPDVKYDYGAPLSGGDKCALINIAMDESGSMSTEQSFMIDDAIPQMVSKLMNEFDYDEVFLCSNGFGARLPTTNDYQHLGCTTGHPDGTLTTPSIVTDWVATGAWEEGYHAIAYSIANVPAAIESINIQSACKTLDKNFILVSDEDRDTGFSATTQEIKDYISDHDYILNLVIDSTINGDLDNVGMQLSNGGFENTVFVRDGTNGEYTTYQNNTNYWDFVSHSYIARSTSLHYIPLVIDTDGALWNLKSLRDGTFGNTALRQSFTNAFVETKAAEIACPGGYINEAGQCAERKEITGGGGDPHITTWKKEHYEYHGQCDLVMMNDDSFADDQGLDIHIRTKIVRYWSYIKTVAIRIGNDILEIEGSADAEDAQPHYWINYEYQGELETVGGFPVTQKIPSVYKRQYTIDLSSKYPGQSIVVQLYKEFVRVKFHGNESAFGKTVGLLGDYKTGKTLARDGATEIDDFTELGDEWQVLPSEPKLFHEVSHPQFPELCIKPEDPRGERKRRLAESTISIEQAEVACAVLTDPLSIKDCVYDILATQDLDMVGAF